MADHALTDPSTLTTAALQREIQNTREIAAAQALHFRDLITTRLDAMDKAIDLLAQYPTRMDEKVMALREFLEVLINGLRIQRDEQFKAIDHRFHERDLRADQRVEMTEKALNAALTSAKEAVLAHNQSSAMAISQSEMAMDKRMEQMEQLISTTAAALESKIDANKDRLTRIDGSLEGTVAARESAQRGISILIAVLMGLLALGGVVVSIVLFVTRRAL